MICSSCENCHAGLSFPTGRTAAPASAIKLGRHANRFAPVRSGSEYRRSKDPPTVAGA